MANFKCPGEWLKTCGQIVEGKRKEGDNSTIATLESHPGCRRRYVFYDECIVEDSDESDAQKR